MNEIEVNVVEMNEKEMSSVEIKFKQLTKWMIQHGARISKLKLKAYSRQFRGLQA